MSGGRLGASSYRATQRALDDRRPAVRAEVPLGRTREEGGGGARPFCNPDDGSDANDNRRTAFWRTSGVAVTFQAVFLVVVVGFLLFLLDNTVYNLKQRGFPTGLDSFDYLRQPAGFAIPDSDFRSSQSLLDALIVGIQNTIKVSLLGIVLATILGVVIGVSRLSSNWLVRKAAALYVETFRNIPVLVIILFWYLGVMIRLPPIRDAVEVLDLLAISNRGTVVPWFDKVGAGVAFGLLALVAFAAALVVWIWRTRRFDRTGTLTRDLVGRLILFLRAVGFAVSWRS